MQISNNLYLFMIHTYEPNLLLFLEFYFSDFQPLWNVMLMNTTRVRVV